MNATDRNHLLLSGMVEAAPLYSHALQGEEFFRVPLQVERLSGTSDHLPVTLPGRLLQGEIRPGLWLRVEGQLRSYDRYDEAGRHLLITAYARHAEPCPSAGPENEVLLEGAVCRPPVYRLTPLGREITDLLIGCKRLYGKTDYLPVIAWGGCARRTAALPPGQRLCVYGRWQSRAYEKVLPDGSTQERVAYEVSASRIVLTG